MVYIFAGNKRQADDCIKRLELHPREAIYVGSAERLIGLNQIHVICCGSYNDRRDYSEVREALSAAQASMQFVWQIGESK